MGNLKTIDSNCGLCANFTGSVEEDNLVYESKATCNWKLDTCILCPDQCTARPCCAEVIENDIDPDECFSTAPDKQKVTLSLFQQIIYEFEDTEVNCGEYFSECFLENQRARGQCCECNEGYTEFDCETPVCNPECVFGTCIEKNDCKCDPGWEGDICDEAICSACEYGVCILPEVCDCYYGFKGDSCDTPTSNPDCVHGNTANYGANDINYDVCYCEAGWTGRLCDVPDCSSIGGCGNGFCVLPNVCECEPYWDTSAPNSQCDIYMCSAFYDPHCETCDQTDCLTCSAGYTLDPTSETCILCADKHEPKCIECDQTNCLECEWPYRVDSVSGKCSSPGIIEFTNESIEVLETDVTF